MIVKQILLVSDIGNVKRGVLRIWILMSPTLKALIVKQILLVSDIGNVKRGVLRIWILMLRCTGLRHQLNLVKTEKKKKKMNALLKLYFISGKINFKF